MQVLKPMQGHVRCCRCTHMTAACAVAFRGKFHLALNEGEQVMVDTDVDIGTGIARGATLAHDTVASDNGLASESLHDEPSAIRFAAVAG